MTATNEIKRCFLLGKNYDITLNSIKTETRSHCRKILSWTIPGYAGVVAMRVELPKSWTEELTQWWRKKTENPWTLSQGNQSWICVGRCWRKHHCRQKQRKRLTKRPWCWERWGRKGDSRMNGCITNLMNMVWAASILMDRESLACYGPWELQGLDMTEQLGW